MVVQAVVRWLVLVCLSRRLLLASPSPSYSSGAQIKIASTATANIPTKFPEDLTSLPPEVEVEVEVEVELAESVVEVVVATVSVEVGLSVVAVSVPEAAVVAVEVAAAE